MEGKGEGRKEERKKASKRGHTHWPTVSFLSYVSFFMRVTVVLDRFGTYDMCEEHMLRRADEVNTNVGGFVHTYPFLSWIDTPSWPRPPL